jgi:hypothetical protein
MISSENSCSPETLQEGIVKWLLMKQKDSLTKKAEPHAFLPDQLVLLDEHSFLAKNQKLAPKWSGPHKILRLKGECNVELLLRHNNKKLITHVNRLKPYFVPKTAAVESPDFFPAQKPAPPPPALQQNVQTDSLLPYDEEVIGPDPYTYEETRRAPSPTPSVRSTHSQQAENFSNAQPTYAKSSRNHVVQERHLPHLQHLRACPSPTAWLLGCALTLAPLCLSIQRYTCPKFLMRRFLF